MKTKKVTIPLLAALLVLSATGCGTNSQETLSSMQGEQQEQKEIEFWARGNETDPLGIHLKKSLEEYEQETGVKVKLQFIPFNDVVTKWNSAFASGTAPDVIDLGIVHIVERVNLGHIIPLDKYYENWENKDQLISSMKDLGTYDGNLYAIAHYPEPNIFAYRKDMFEEVGLNPEKAPANWEELLEYSQKLAKKDDNGNIVQTGFAVPTMTARYFANSMIRQAGSSFVDEETGLPAFTTPEAKRTVEFIKTLHQYSTVYDHDKVEELPILKGTAAMEYIHTSAIKKYLEDNPDMKDKFGFTACVPDKENATWCGVYFYGITSQAEDPDLAFDLISYLTSKEVLEDRTEELGIPSAFKYTEDTYIAQDPEINQAITDAIACGYGNPKVAWSNTFQDVLDQMLEEVFYETKSVDQALEDAQKKLMAEVE